MHAFLYQAALYRLQGSYQAPSHVHLHHLTYNMSSGMKGRFGQRGVTGCMRSDSLDQCVPLRWLRAVRGPRARTLLLATGQMLWHAVTMLLSGPNIPDRTSQPDRKCHLTGPVVNRTSVHSLLCTPWLIRLDPCARPRFNRPGSSRSLCGLWERLVNMLSTARHGSPMQQLTILQAMAGDAITDVHSRR